MLEQSFFERLKWKLSPVFGWLMEQSVRYWANHYLDQFEHFSFRDNCGNTVYVSMSYYAEYPDAFCDTENPDKSHGDT